MKRINSLRCNTLEARLNKIMYLSHGLPQEPLYDMDGSYWEGKMHYTTRQKFRERRRDRQFNHINVIAYMNAQEYNH
jgi:hypothetical protein